MLPHNYNDGLSLFEELLETDNSVSVHNGFNGQKSIV